jgi:hypothetical protein
VCPLRRRVDQTRAEIEQVYQCLQAKVDQIESSTQALEQADVFLQESIRAQQGVESQTSSVSSTKQKRQRVDSCNSLLNVNFGGECVAIERDIVCDSHIQPNLFSALFHPRWERVLPRDKHGNIYLEWDYSWVKPILDAYEIIHYDSNSTKQKASKLTILENADQTATSKLYASWFQIAMAIRPPSKLQFSSESSKNHFIQTISTNGANPNNGDCFPIFQQLQNFIQTTFPTTTRTDLSLHYMPYRKTDFQSLFKEGKCVLLLGKDGKNEVIGCIFSVDKTNGHKFAKFMVLKKETSSLSEFKSLKEETKNASGQWNCYETRNFSCSTVRIKDTGIELDYSISYSGSFSMTPNVHGTFSLASGPEATLSPHETSAVWTCNATNKSSANNICRRTLVGPISMFTVSIDGSPNLWEDQPMDAFDSDEASTLDISANNSLEEVDLNSRLTTIHEEYVMSLDQVEIEWFHRLQQSMLVLIILQGKPLSDLNLYCRSSTKVAEELQSLDSQIAAFSKPKRQQKFSEDIIWFSVRGKSVCLSKSTILDVIPESQLAIRVNGDWKEQNSTLDREGRIIIVSISFVILITLHDIHLPMCHIELSFASILTICRIFAR